MRDKIPFLSLILLVGIVISGFFYFFEKHQINKNVGFSKKATINQFLAAEIFLDNLGIQVDASINYLYFDEIPIDTTVFITRVDSILLTTEQIDSALEWLQRGGNLIVGVERQTGSTDSLLSRVDVSAEQYEDTKENVFFSAKEKLSEKLKKQNELLDQGKKDESDNSQAKQKDEVSLFFSNSERPLIIDFFDDIQLNHPYLTKENSNEKSDLNYRLYSSASNDHGIKLIQFEIGEGFLTVLSGSQLWRNDNIDVKDNAYFLAELIGEVDQVHFYSNINATPFSVLLKSHFPFALLFLILALLLWIWQQLIRTARVQEYQVGHRRALSEHLEASSELFAKNDRYDLLLKPILNDIEKAMISYQHNFHRLEKAKKIALIAKHSGIDESKIEQWITSLNDVNDSPTFLSAVQIGKLIRNRL